MRNLLLLILTLGVCPFGSAQTYFPVDPDDKHPVGITQFEAQWYSAHLSAMKEPSLFASDNATREEYRFLWLRTFHKPIAIRIWSDGSGAQMRVVRLSGAGGYGPGHIESDTTVKVGPEEWKRFRDYIAKAQFWQMPTKPSPEVLGFDGSQWILEARDAAKYHVVDRWTPHDGAYVDSCRFLITLAKLQIPEDEFY